MKKKLIITVSILVFVAVGLFTSLYVIDVYKILEKSGHVYGDEPVYESYEHIVNSAHNVYEGLIESVSFDIFNLTTQDMYKGEKMTEEERKHLAFVTIYKVRVDKVYQGRQVDYFYIMVEGGIDGYNDFSQGVVLKNAGLNYRSINSWGDLRGKKILFSTKDRGNLQSALSIPYAEYEVGSEKYQEFINYLSSEEYYNPPKTTKDIYIVNEEVVYTSAMDIIDNSSMVFEGKVQNARLTVGEFQGKKTIITYYGIKIDDNSFIELKIYGFAENLDLLKQYRYLAACGTHERLLYKDANLLEVGKSYLFAINKQNYEENDSIIIEPANPSQFAFATDDSNAPGGVTYSMIKEYLKNK